MLELVSELFSEWFCHRIATILFRNIAWPTDEVRFEETSEFILQRNDSLDAIIVQEGQSFPLLTCFWENNNFHQPAIGIIGEDTFIPHQHSKVVGTCFQRTALQSSVDLLFNMLDDVGFNDQVVNIEPSLSINLLYEPNDHPALVAVAEKFWLTVNQHQRNNLARLGQEDPAKAAVCPRPSGPML